MKSGADMDPKPEDLDPGIRRFVVLLREAGFDTTDSGDGVSKSEAGDAETLDFPHVAISSSLATLFADCDRILAFMRTLNIKVGPAQIEGSYDPAQEGALIMVTSIDDAALPPEAQ